MAENTPNQLDALTNKYTEGFEKFSSSKSGNVILDFALFKRNLVPHTLQILFLLGVAAAWVVAVLGILGQGPIGAMCVEMVTKDGNPVMSFNFLKALGIGAAIIVFGPFIIHYALEVIKYVFEKILAPLWNALIIRFLVNLLPQLLPFLFERCMKLIDVVVIKVDPFLEAVIGLGIAASVAVVSVLKGVVWLPKKICQRIGRWLDAEPVRK